MNTNEAQLNLQAKVEALAKEVRFVWPRHGFHAPMVVYVRPLPHQEVSLGLYGD